MSVSFQAWEILFLDRKGVIRCLARCSQYTLHS